RKTASRSWWCFLKPKRSFSPATSGRPLMAAPGCMLREQTACPPFLNRHLWSSWRPVLRGSAKCVQQKAPPDPTGGAHESGSGSEFHVEDGADRMAVDAA